MTRVSFWEQLVTEYEDLEYRHNIEQFVPAAKRKQFMHMIHRSDAARSAIGSFYFMNHPNEQRTRSLMRKCKKTAFKRWIAFASDRYGMPAEWAGLHDSDPNDSLNGEFWTMFRLHTEPTPAPTDDPK